MFDKLLGKNVTTKARTQYPKPTAFVRSFNQSGYIIIEFSQNMIKIKNMTAFRNATVLINGR